MMIKNCAEKGCRLATWAKSPFCFMHFIEHVERSLTDEQRKEMLARVDVLLKTLSYREREILRLRTGLGDGYVYTREEVGRIFKVTRSKVSRIEWKSLRKLEHPVRFAKLEEFLQVYSFPEPQPKIIEAVHFCEDELISYLAKHSESIRKVSSDTFEKIIAEIMNGLGFEVELTQKTRDGGRDIVAVAADHLGIRTKYIVECKKYARHRPVRVELVRSLYGVKQKERADHAILATTSYFTEDAVKFCRSPEIWNLHLKDLEAIQEWLKTYREMIGKGTVLL